jgi:hypothetical protein
MMTPIPNPKASIPSGSESHGLENGRLPDALIGKSGFVGRQLAELHDFAARFNRSNIHEAAGQRYGTVVCAAAPGSMFVANRDPDGDAKAVEGVFDALSSVEAENLVLISTIAVLDRFDGGYTETTQSFQLQVPYGLNRRRLEVFCQEKFENCLVLRLPALYGPGLSKNFIFDLLNPIPSMLTDDRLSQIANALPNNLEKGFAGLYDKDATRGLFVIDRARVAALAERSALETELIHLGFSARSFTNPNSTFQYYDMSRLWADIALGLENRLDILHIAPEPLRAGDVHLELTGQEMAPNAAPLHYEDMCTGYAQIWGRQGQYSAGADEVMHRLRRFFALEGGKAVATK